jgi:Leucine-rich repeat (LRR) protein
MFKKEIIILVLLSILCTYSKSICQQQQQSETCLQQLNRAMAKPSGFWRFTFDSTITSIPPEIIRLNELEDVRFEYSSISDLPDSFFSLPLKKVVFMGTRNLNLRNVLIKFAQCPTLEFLGFGYMNIDRLPEEIGLLQKLKFLGLWGNHLSTLPVSIGNIVTLEGIALTGNSIDSFPETIQKLSHLEFVGLDGNNLKQLPSNFLKLPSLKDINLARNPGLNVDTVLAQLMRYKIVEISLQECAMKNLPATIGHFNQLTWLDLGTNQLTELPTEILQLQGLVHLLLENNRLKYLPEEIGRLSNLRYFELGSNQLAVLPKSLDTLSNQLVELSLRKNKFSEEEKQRIMSVFGKAVSWY